MGYYLSPFGLRGADQVAGKLVYDRGMNPGDMRTFRHGQGDAVVLAVGLWAERSGKQLHIHITGTDCRHTTVTNDPDSVRYHRTLFRDFRKVLIANQCWPFGGEGAETEEQTPNAQT